MEIVGLEGRASDESQFGFLCVVAELGLTISAVQMRSLRERTLLRSYVSRSRPERCSQDCWTGQSSVSAGKWSKKGKNSVCRNGKKGAVCDTALYCLCCLCNDDRHSGELLLSDFGELQLRVCLVGSWSYFSSLSSRIRGLVRS
jgi:hypothetical protein